MPLEILQFYLCKGEIGESFGEIFLNVDHLCCFSLLLCEFLFSVETESPWVVLEQLRLFGKQMSLEDRKVGFRLDWFLVITCQLGQ